MPGFAGPPAIRICNTHASIPIKISGAALLVLPFWVAAIGWLSGRHSAPPAPECGS
jgi:hypothetical protein